jgi:hypothetical protein
MARNFVRNAEKKKQLVIESDVSTVDLRSPSSSSCCSDTIEVKSSQSTTPEDSEGRSLHLNRPYSCEALTSHYETPEDSEGSSSCLRRLEPARSSSQEVLDCEDDESTYKKIFDHRLNIEYL